MRLWAASPNKRAGRRDADRPYSSKTCRLLKSRHAAAIARPRRLVSALLLGPLLAVADHAEAGIRNALRDQVALHGRSPPRTEREVVLARAALVAMPLDRDLVLA